MNSEKLLYVRAESATTALSTLLASKDWSFRRVQQIVLNGGYKLNVGFYDELRELLEQYNQQHWQNRLTLTRMARLWMRNTFQNIATFATNSIPYQQIHTAPAVVVGAGPSLESAIAWMKTNRSRFLLVCVDTAFGTLCEAGLQPDVLIVLEGQLANYRDFLSSGRATLDDRTTVFADISSSPPVLRSLGVQPLFFRSEFFTSRFFSRMDEHDVSVRSVPPLGSVGTLAVLLASQLTSGPILLAGIDFSYRIGKSHAGGSPSHLSVLIDHDRRLPAESASVAHLVREPQPITGHSGKEIRTDLVLYSYSGAVSSMARQSGNIFDTNQDSILDGVDIVGMNRIQELLSGPDFDSDVLSRHPRLHPRASEDIRLKFLQNELQLISAAQQHCSTLLSSPVAVTERERFESTDYLYLDFPDLDSIRAFDRGVVSRIAASTLFYKTVLTRAINTVSGNDGTVT